MTYSLPLFPDDPAPRPAPVPPVTFTGPAAQRALVITPSFLAWVAWRAANCVAYGNAVWVLDRKGAKAFHEEAFEVIEL